MNNMDTIIQKDFEQTQVVDSQLNACTHEKTTQSPHDQGTVFICDNPKCTAVFSEDGEQIA